MLPFRSKTPKGDTHWASDPAGKRWSSFSSSFLHSGLAMHASYSRSLCSRLRYGRSMLHLVASRAYPY